MSQRKNIIKLLNPEVLDGTGGIILYEAYSFIHPFEIEPTKGKYDFTKDPKAMEILEDSITLFESKFEGNDEEVGFPYWGQYHAKLVNCPEFDRNDFLHVPEMSARKAAYVKQHIINNYEDPDWYNIITEYIDWLDESFGEFPYGYGMPLFRFQVLWALSNSLTPPCGIPIEKADRLLSYINALIEPELTGKFKENTTADLNFMIQTYQQWVSIFPFDLNSYFLGLKERFAAYLPIFDGDAVVNRYSHVKTYNKFTPESLYELIINMTENLLTHCSAAALYEKGLLVDENRIEFELILNQRKFELKCGYKNDSPMEVDRYKSMITKWFNDECHFIQRIKPLLEANRSNALTIDTKSEEIIKTLTIIDSKIWDADKIYDKFNGLLFSCSKKVFDDWFVDGVPNRTHPKRLDKYKNMKIGKSQLYCFIQLIVEEPNFAKESYFSQVFKEIIKKSDVKIDDLRHAELSFRYIDMLNSCRIQ